MPRRRSRSGKKSSADIKDSPRSVVSDKEDAVTAGNSDAAEHSSGKDGTDSAEEEMRLPHIVEPQEWTLDATDSKIADSQSKTPEVSSTSSGNIILDTSSSVNERRCHSGVNRRGRSEEISNTDIVRPSSTRPSSLVSRGKLVFESRQEKKELDDKWIRNPNDSQENIYTSQQDKNLRESFKMNEKTKTVSSENKHNKNIPNFEEHFNKEDGWEGSRQKEDKSDGEKQLMKMASQVDIPPEGTDDATRNGSIPEEKNSARIRRQKKLKRSKERGDMNPNESLEHSDDGIDLDISTEDEESNKTHHSKEEVNQTRSSSSRPTSGYKIKREASNNNPADKTPSLTSNEKSSDNEFDTKISVYEIKRRFSCHAEKSNESFKSRSAALPTEAESATTDDVAHRGRVPSSSGPCTTELYVATVAGKESSSASFLSAAESSSGIFVDEKSVKYKPKSLHSGWTNDSEKTLETTEEENSDYNCSDSKKVSVKQLKERLISSCSDISDKAVEGKRSDDGKNLVKNTSNDTSLEKLSKGYEKEEIGLSVKERLETYRCQASKAYHNIQSFYIEQELPSVTSIKELQSSFNKMVQPNAPPVGPVNRSKVKNINDDLAQMQSYSMKCKSCGKQVFFMERIMAEKAMWHKKCFRCKECQKQLTVENYKSQDGELYCQSHYMNILKPKPTDDTVSASSVIEEIKIPPLNLKPLFEKNQSSSSNSPPSSPPSVERSPKFLKRLAKFEGTYRGESEEDEIDEVSSSEDTQSSSPEKKSKSDELEAYIEEESKKKPASKETKGRKKRSHYSSPNSSTLQVHLKQFFEKSPDDSEHINSNKSSEESTRINKNLGECLYSGDSLKKPTQCAKVEDNDSGDAQVKVSRIVSEETEINFRYQNNNDLEVTCERTKTQKQTRDVQSVISYFNQQ